MCINNYLIRWRVHPSELLEVLFDACFNGLKCICAVQPFSLYKFVKKWLKQQQTKFRSDLQNIQRHLTAELIFLTQHLTIIISNFNNALYFQNLLKRSKTLVHFELSYLPVCAQRVSQSRPSLSG